MSQQAPATPFKAPLGLIAILGGLSAFAPLSTDMHLPGLPQLTRDLGATPSAGALTVSAFFLGMCLGQLFHGPISDRIGRRAPILGGVTLFVASMLATAFANSIELVIGLRFLQALGGCAGLVVARAVVRDRFAPQETAQVLSLLLLIMSLAPIVAPVLGGFVLTFASWRAIFLILAAFGAVVGLAAYFGLRESRTEAAARLALSESPLRSYLALLREPKVMTYALAGGASHAGLLTYLTAAPEVMIGHFGLSPQAFGWAFAANGVGLLMANFTNRRLLVRIGYERLLRRANLVSLAAAGVLMLTAVTGLGGFWGAALPLFVIVAAVGFTQPNAFAGAMAHDPQRAGSASALMGFLQFGLGALGGAAAGALYDGSARPMAAVILAAYVAAALVLRLGPSRTA